ncbi:hypothetical protein HBI73_229060 [Parastagonospora nodorum]|nr:hypothetical protein HBH99_245310 [Parastagonospora nodorum]KAH5053572.1 hypothetical protein HBI73_229060 [Parastagonospora nodorum]
MDDDPAIEPRAAAPAVCRPKLDRCSQCIDTGSIDGTAEECRMDQDDELYETFLLPYFVLCGDQSSGKTSVLEAITGLSFPSTAEMGTCFAVEMVIRRKAAWSILYKIRPDRHRNPADRRRLRGFHEDSTFPEDVNRAMELAADAIKVNKPGPALALSRDVLCIEVGSPTSPELTLVDLPGLFHSATTTLNVHDKSIAFALTEQYLGSSLAVIVLVIPATSTLNTQVALRLAKEADPDGSRTLGIITKTSSVTNKVTRDRLSNLARNTDVHFDYGWHMLRNRSDNEGITRLAQRDANEERFFSTGDFRDLPRDVVGIKALQDRIKTAAIDRFQQELPNIAYDLEAEIDDQARELMSVRLSIKDLKRQQQILLRGFAVLEATVVSTLATVDSTEFKDATNRLPDPITNHRHLQTIRIDLNSSMNSLQSAMP